MAPKLYFLGTGGSADVRGLLSEGGFLIKTEKAVLHVDPGPGAAVALGSAKIKPTGVLIAHPDRGHDADLVKAEHVDKQHGDIEVFKKEKGVVFRLPECKISYITHKLSVKEMANYAADVLVLSVHDNSEKLITKLKPKLTILTCFDLSMHNKNPVYIARDLQKATGIQTIAAEDGLTVDLYSYSALPEQKSLKKFTGE